MNQRIRELAKQADGVFIHKLMTGAKQYTFLEKDLEKFAELIVRECAKFCDDKNSKLLGTMMKEHFGVEE